MIKNFFFLSGLLIMLLFGWGLLAGCGDGGNSIPGTRSASLGLVSGSVSLGPISNGEVVVKTLEGDRIGSGRTITFDPVIDTITLDEKTLLNNVEDRRVGRFDIDNLNRANLSDEGLVIVRVRGGQDIDPDDDGFIERDEGLNGPLLRGSIYAVVRLSDLIKGNVVINAFTTMAFAGVQESTDANQIKERLDRFARYIFKDMDFEPINGDLNADGLLNMLDIYQYDASYHHFDGTNSNRVHDECLRAQHLYGNLLPDDDGRDTFIESLLNGADVDYIESYMAAGNGFGDADGDGLSNIFEDPDTHDTDGDGKFDADPTEKDMDGDGMSDDAEFRYGLNPWVDDALDDTDRDGINNIKEIVNGLDPVDRGDGAAVDTDADGVSNGFEIEIGTNPKNSAPQPLNATIPLSVDQNTVGRINISASDPEGDAIRYIISGAPANGTASIDASGHLTYEPSANYHGSDTLTVELNDTANGGIAKVRVDVTVNRVIPHAPILEVTVAPEIVRLGASSTLTWRATHADVCFIEPGIGSVHAAGSIQITPMETITYTITARGPGGTSTDEVTVTVYDPSPSIVINATPGTISIGDSSTIEWNSTNADSCVIEPGIGSVDVNGSIQVSPTETTTYSITAAGPGGKATADVAVNVTYPLPAVTVGADPNAITIGESSTLSWTTSHANNCVIDQGIGSVDLTGSVVVQPDETTTYTITAAGPGGTSTANVTITVSYPSPGVSFSVNPEGIAVGESGTLNWKTTYADSVGIDNGIGNVDISGSYIVSPSQTTTYTLTAEGPGGTAIKSTTITIHSPPPTVSLVSDVDILQKGESATLSWSSENAQNALIDNGVGAVSLNGSVVVFPEHTTAFTITVTGPSGSDSARVVIRVAGNPEPQTEGSFGAQYEDLVPLDATIDQYDPKRFSVVTGIVQGIDDLPVEGVSISVFNHPEYGSTLTDTTGLFSIPAEGGTTITLTYSKTGLIPAHRQVYVPWNDYAVAETVQMISEDPIATTLTFDGNPDNVVTHQSVEVIDEFGSRSTTMVFTGDNRVYVVDEDGNDVERLTTITTRATEFTTPESMPAKLPPTSAYTYCVELSVDGNQNVRFEDPVTIWVDNFLGFDVGEIVPVGYYDRNKGVWVPSDNGVVVKLLDTDTDGVADAIDTDGDDQPDDLNNSGFFSDEVTGLGDAFRYPPGSTFWRAAVTHFSPWDLNWPFGPPLDAVFPIGVGEAVVDIPKDEDPVPEPGRKKCLNSYIEQRNRVFHEDIPIPGTDMSLHYASDRVKGYVQKITVPASGGSVPESLKQIIVRVRVAGQTFEQVLDPLPDQTAEFVWNGLDYLERPVNGPANVRVDVGFEYDLVYYNAQESSFQAFGQTGGNPTGISARQPVILWKHSIIHLPGRVAGVADGWTLSSHHHLSPLDPSTLLKGDGTINQNNVNIINTMAGGGGSFGDDGPATEAWLSYPHGLAVDASGNLYIADRGFNRIRKIDSDGIITTVAGNGEILFSGDGGPATEATVWAPVDVAVDLSGNLFIADSGNNRIRKVDTDGVITTVAGTGVVGFSGDGGPAVEARFNTINSIAVDLSGNLYIADHLNHRVRKVDTNGIITTVVSGAIYPSGVFVDTPGNIYVAEYWNYRVRKIDTSGVMTTVAGNGTPGYSGDGGPATEAQLNNPSWIFVDASGHLYINDGSNHCIRRIDNRGIITTVVGSGIQGFSGDDGPAVKGRLNGGGDIVFDGSGKMYVADNGNGRVRKISSPSIFSDFLAEGSIGFAEENGLGHIMSNTGFHLMTIDTDTVTALRAFGYDIDDNLISITDQFGNQVTIDRDSNGVPTAIISQGGITTGLDIDTNNHLTRITYPDGNFYEFEYTANGLMTVEVEPESNRFVNYFDSLGRLTDVLDEEGGHWAYSRTINSEGDVVTEVLSGEGNLTSIRNHTYSTGAYTSTMQDSTGAETFFSQSDDGLTVDESLPCGMEFEYKYALDTEYKFKFVKEMAETTPLGLEQITLINKNYLDTNADDVPDLITETVTVNGKATVFSNNVLQSEKSITSPEGRSVTTTYDSATLLTQDISVPGLFDTAYAYDNQGRLTAIATNTRGIDYTYNTKGFLETVTDSEGYVTTYIYDDVGRIKQVDRPDTTSVWFTYDNNGNMTVLTNPFIIDHAFNFNKVNLNNSYQTPISGTYSYVYDKDRRLVTTNFPSGNQINNVYVGGRLEQTQTPEGNIDYTYLCGTKIDSITKGSESITYGYDGKLITSEMLTGTLNQTLGYSYNNDFNLSTFTYADDTVNYVYDNDGLLTTAGEYTISRNAGNGLPESVSGGALNLLRTFNGFGEVSDENYDINNHNITTWNLIRNNNGRITNKIETIDGTASNYVYTFDSMGRLLTVTKDGTLIEEYGYDENGTRIYEMNQPRGIVGRSFSYDDEDHLLTAGSTIYQYDLDGFLTTKAEGSEVTTYDYSSRGELLNVILANGALIEYTHDALGRRIAKKVNGVTIEKYLWQGMTCLLAVFDGSDNLIMRFEYADGRMPVSMTKGGSTYYLTYDQVGSLRIVADATGSVIKRIDYDSFGNIIGDTNPSFHIPFGFAGGLHDRNTDLVRFGYRDYDPDTGRWTAKDPIGFLGGDVDLYGYCMNDAVNLVDPRGLTFDPLQLYQPSDFPMPVLSSINIGGSWVGRDFMFTLYDRNTGGPVPDVKWGKSTTVAGAGVSFVLEDPGRCPLPEEEPEITVGQSKYLGVFTALDAKRYGVNFGLGLGLPGVTVSAPSPAQEISEFTDPLAEVGF